MVYDEEPIDKEDVNTVEGRQESLESGGMDAREEAFLAGYDEEDDIEEEDSGLEDDERLED